MKHQILLDRPVVELFHMKILSGSLFFLPPPCPSLFCLFSLVFKPEQLDTDVLDLVQSLKFAFYDTAKCDSGMPLEALATVDSTSESFFLNDSFE